MRVSVIVPTFNRAHMIKCPLESIIRQTYKDIEIIVVDDGSSDNTEEVVEELSRKGRRPILYEKKPNGGCASARNRGLHLATGELISFLDSDDAWVKNALETLVSELMQSGADFVYSPAYEVDMNGTKILNYPVAANKPETFAIEHFKNTNVRHGSCIFRKEIFKKVPRMDESLKYNEDSDFLQKVSIVSKAAYSSVPTVIHFHHSMNKSSDRVAINRALLRSSENVLTEHPDFASALGDSALIRLVEIKCNLIESLIMVGQFNEAKKLAGKIKHYISVPTRISLLMGSNIPIKLLKLRKYIRF